MVLEVMKNSRTKEKSLGKEDLHWKVNAGVNRNPDEKNMQQQKEFAVESKNAKFVTVNEEKLNSMENLLMLVLKENRSLKAELEKHKKSPVTAKDGLGRKRDILPKNKSEFVKLSSVRIAEEKEKPAYKKKNEVEYNKKLLQATEEKKPQQRKDKALKLCPYFIYDNCRFGIKCRYLHERRSCRYHSQGICKFGRECFNLHEVKETRKYVAEIKKTTSNENPKIWKKKVVDAAVHKNTTKNEEVLEKEESKQTSVNEAFQKIRSLNQAISKNIESTRNENEIIFDTEPSQFNCRITKEEFGEMKPDITNLLDEKKGSALSMEKEESMESCILSIQRHIC